MGESSRPRARISRDRRVDSTIPPPREEAPLRRMSPRFPSAARLPRTSSRVSDSVEPIALRHADLTAEIERLKQERAKDADEIAQMLVRLAEAERTLAEANEARDHAVRRAEAAERSVEVMQDAQARALEEARAEVASARQQATGADERLAAALSAMAAARALLDETR